MKRIVIILLSFGAWGCTEQIEPTPLTYTKLLSGESSKAWIMTAYQIREKDKPTISVPVPFGPEDACVFDDQYVFSANEERSFTINEGASKCDPNDPDIFITDNWSMVNATATLNFVVPILFSGSLPFTVHKLTEKQLEVDFFFEEFSSYRFIFKHVENE